MKVTISEKIPANYEKQKGTTYETKYFYTGFGRYNEQEKTFEVMKLEADGSYSFSKQPHEAGVFSRVYHVEAVTLTLYSASPRVWKEVVGEHTSFFQEIVQEGPAQPNLAA
jgi:hypothetical protein